MENIYLPWNLLQPLLHFIQAIGASCAINMSNITYDRPLGWRYETNRWLSVN